MLKRGERLQKLLTLLVTWAALLACFIVYEQYYVKGQQQYSKEKGFRVLAALSGELNSTFEQARALSESLVKLAPAEPQKREGADQSHRGSKLPAFGPGAKSQDNTTIPDSFRRYVTLYLEDAPISSQSFEAATECWRADRDHIPIEMIPDRNTLTVRIHCFANADPKQPDSPDVEKRILIYTLDLKPWIQSAFREMGQSYFDDLLVAESEGHVVLEESTTGLSVAHLKSVVPSSDVGELKQPGAQLPDKAIKQAGGESYQKGSESQDIRNQKDKQQATPPSDAELTATERRAVEKVTEATAVTEITLAGESYELFSQPTRIILKNYTPNRRMWNLVVCGLRRKERSEEESHALPYSVLIWAALVAVLLLSLSWPVFKLHYMSNTERFSPRDGWYLCLAIFLAASSAMLMLLFASYTGQARDAADAHMGRVAARIKDSSKQEIKYAYQQLKQIRGDPDFWKNWEKRDPNDPPHEPNYLDHLPKAKQQPCYPYFEIAFWANRVGKQLLKFDVRQVATPASNVGAFSYFKDSISDLDWSREAGPGPGQREGPDPAEQAASCQRFSSDIHTDHVHLEPVFTLNTREFLAMLSAPFADDPETGGDKQIAAQVLAARPLSLVDPVMPPGYGFAVIDADCNVLFHSNAIRDLKENFCEESAGVAELRPWLFSGVDNPVDISYTGSSERAYITEMPWPWLFSRIDNNVGVSSTEKPGQTGAAGPGSSDRSPGPTFLIVFREPEVDLTLSLSIVVVCSILMGAYFTIPLLLAGLNLSLRGPLHLTYAPRLIWPRPEKALSYLHLSAANGLMLLLFRLAYPYLYEAPLLGLTLAVAFLSVLFTILKLSSSSRALVWFGMALTSGAVWALLGSLPFPLVFPVSFPLIFLPSEPLTEWRIVSALLSIFGLIAVFLAGDRGLSIPERVKGFAQKRFTAFYALAVLSVITAATLVPCAAFFKYAYDTVSELSMKHDQLILSERLLARRNRIRRYYETVCAPGLPEQRMAENWDRYDRDFFAMEGEPTLVDYSRAPCPTAGGGEVPRQRQGPPLQADQPEKSKCAGCKPEEAVLDSLNVSLEKKVASATLYFPANQLGSEMSKLGVASDQRDENPEHCWTEATPTRFRLQWKPGSRLPNLCVTSNYRDWGGLGWWPRFFLVLLWAVLFFWLLSLMKKIFFTDVESAPHFQAVDWKTVEDIKTNSLVIGRARSGKTDRLRALPGLAPDDWRDLRVELKQMVGESYYQAPSCQGSVLVLDHFEFNIKDRQYNLARLNLLEDMLYVARCKLVAVSTVDPLYFLTEGAPAMLSDGKDPEEAHRLLDRWARALSKFTKVNLTDAGRDQFEEKVSEFAKVVAGSSPLATWLKEECNCTAFLRKVGSEIFDQPSATQPATREQLVSTVLDRADSYYHVLWSGLTASERLTLCQLALDGWANPKNAAAIQQLERKLLIRKAPMYRIMNESFRRFIASAEHADEIAQWEKSEQQSAWRALRLVLIAAVIGAGVWLLYAQAALFQTATGYIAAIATLLTAVGGLFGRSKRAASAAPEPTQGSS